MDKHLKALADAPLADPLKINLPEGKRPNPRGPRIQTERAPGDLSPTELKERKQKELQQKQSDLLDYYATTDKDAETVARHVGLYFTEEVGADEETDKPILERRLDIKRAGEELAWRRKARG